MTTKIAWEVMNKVVQPRAEELGIMGTYMGTIFSKIDWEKGVALQTTKGVIHVKGTGEIIDEDNLLQYLNYFNNADGSG